MAGVIMETAITPHKETAAEMESSEEDPEFRNDIAQPPSYAEAISTSVPLPLPSYRPAELRSRSPPPPYSEVIGQILHDNQSNTVTAQPLRSAYQSLTANHDHGWTRHSRHATGRNRPRHSSRTSWRTTELQVPRGHVHSDATENLLQVRHPTHLRLLRPPPMDSRQARNEFMTVNNKKIIHILAGGLGLLIPLGFIIAMATRETQPEVETSTKLTTPSVYYMDNSGVIDVDADGHGKDNGQDAVSDLHTQSFRWKRRKT